MAIAMARRKFPTFALFTIGLVLSSDVSFRGFFVECKALEVVLLWKLCKGNNV